MKTFEKMWEIQKKYDRIWLVIGQKGLHIYWRYNDIPKGLRKEAYHE